MKPNKVFLIIASVFLAFGILLGGIYFYITKTLTPENVRSLITKNLQASFPQASIVVGAVEFGFGTSIDFHIKEIKVFGKTDLFQLSDARLRIPVWAILKGGGVVELEVNAPKFNFLQLPNKDTNWSLAMATSDSSDEGELSVTALPAFLISSRLNIKMRDITLTYRLTDNNKGELKVSKLLIKELGLENPAAFEIDTSFEFEQEVLGIVSGKILLIGEADLHRFISEGKLAVLSVATVSNIGAKELLPIRFPDFRSEVKLEASRDGVMRINAKTSIRNGELSFQAIKEKSSLSINQINFAAPFQEVLEVIGYNIKGLSAGKSTASVTGAILFEQENLRPELAFNLSPGATYSYTSNINTSFDLSSKLIDNNLSLVLNNQMFQGRLITSMDYVLPQNFNFNSQVIKPVNLSTKGIGLVLKKALIESLMDSSSSVDVQENEKDTDSAKKGFVLPFTHRLEIRESRFEDLLFELDHDLSLSRSAQVKSTLQLTVEQGKITSSIIANIGKETDGKASVQLTSFPGKAVNPFIEKSIGKLDGQLAGSADIAFKIDNQSLQFDGKYKVLMSNGRLDRINLNDLLLPLKSKLAQFSTKLDDTISQIKLEPDFKKLEASGLVNNSRLNFKKFHLIAIKDKFDLKGSGHLSLKADSPSEVFAIYKDTDGNLSSVLRAEIGTEELPLKLIGNGVNLKPELAYTIKKLAPIYAKKKGTQKLKDSFKKVIKEKDIKKVNKLLKGILQ